MMEKTKNIHLRNIVDVDSCGVGTDGQFELIFTAWNNKTATKKKVILYLERDYIKYVAEHLWQVISGEEAELDLIKEAMNKNC